MSTREGEGGGPDGAAIQRTLTIVNARGLHARAAAKFVRCVELFDADVRVARQDQEVSGLSIMGLLLLTASPGCTIEVSANGPEAQAALDAITALVENRFEEE